ncbi:MAG: protein kinase domain-containing protein [Desulfitobacteriaceae bacterium]
MSPEHFLGIEKTTKASDIYSFGLILYEMLTGHPAFKAPTSYTKEEEFYYYQDKHMNKISDVPSVYFEEIPEELDNIVAHCLEKRQEQRPKSFESIKQVLIKVYEKITADNMNL